MKKILVLGGTKDGRQIADRLYGLGLPVIYSIQGLVRTPDLPCEIRVGGFSRIGGLSNYLVDKSVAAVVDATHPYAAKITRSAFEATCKNSIPLFRFDRKAWEPCTGDDWVSCSDVSDALDKMSRQGAWKSGRIFISSGQLQADDLARLSDEFSHVSFLYRTAVEPKFPLPANIEWIKAIGPFSAKDEKALLKREKIAMIVSKNSGGSATYGKILAARELGIRVLMIDRPAPVQGIKPMHDPDALVAACLALYS